MGLNFIFTPDPGLDRDFGIKVLEAPGNNPQMQDFSEIQRIMFQRPPNDTSLTFEIGLPPFFPAGWYSFYLTCLYNNNETGPSNIYSIFINGDSVNMINVDNYPPWEAAVGVEYNFTIVAHSYNNEPVLFRAVNVPDGMTIDQNTGLITWTPTQSGYYDAYVEAYLASAPNNPVPIMWQLYVRQCQNPGKITGDVKDQNNDPVNMGIAEIYMMNPGDSVISIAEAPIINGHFESNALDAGTYYVEFTAPRGYFYGSFKTEWWQDAQTMETATPIILTCEQTINLQVQVQLREEVNITFDNQPPLTGTINQPYTFDCNATASNNGTLVYTLVDGPGGMTINSTTGEVSWTPTEAGNYYCSLSAALADDPDVFESLYWNIKVLNCQQPAVINCTIKDQNGNNVQYGEVQIFQKFGTDSVVLMPVDNTFFMDGQYTSPSLDAGTYYIYFISEGNMQKYDQGEWWENASDFATATPIVLNCGDNITLQVVLEAHEYVYMEWQNAAPPESAKLNQEYTFDFNAIASDSSVINYELIGAPVGMTIDTVTGIVTWTPTEAGMYDMSVRAYIVSDQENSLFYSWNITVMQCETPAVISGTVKDENNNPVSYGTVYVFSTTDSTNMRYSSFYNASITNGSYSVEVDAGDYYIMFLGQDYETQWYDNVTDQKDATIVTVNCGDTYIANAVIHAYRPPQQYSVSGSVLDITDNSAVALAVVQFIGTDNNGNKGMMYATLTNLDGSYQIYLPEANYTIYCQTLNDTVIQGMTIKRMLPMYYNQQTDPAMADILALHADTTGINFLLTPRPNYQNTITGVVKDTTGAPLDQTFVIAYLVETDPLNQQYMYDGYPSQTGTDGTFAISNLIPGNYILLAAPNSPDYVPGFYKEGQVATMMWNDATQITVTDNGTFGAYTITLENFRYKLAYHGGIHGMIKHHHGAIKNSNDPQGGEALQGAYVYVINNETNQIVGHTTSDKLGEYQVDGLNKGVYKIIADKVGFQSYTGITSIENNDKIIEVNLDIQESITDVTDQPLDQTSLIAYPNPATDLVNVIFPSTIDSPAKLSLYNSMGSEVSSVNIQVVAGSNNYSVNTTNMASGAYFVRISMRNQTLVVPLTISK
jgi:hypothetical protein